MMYGEEKSDSPSKVAAKQANKPERSGARWSEGAEYRGTRNSYTCAGTQSRESMSQRLSRGKLRSSGRKNGLQHCSTC